VFSTKLCGAQQPQWEYRLGCRGSEGDYILTADLLIHAGAPLGERNLESGETALDLLQNMPGIQPGTKASRERDGLISLLQGQYWQEDWKNRNPFLEVSSPQEIVWLIMKGAASNGRSAAGVVDCTRVRSIRPDLRRSVLQALHEHKATCEAFLQILGVIGDASTNNHPLGAFAGLQRTVFARVAEFAGCFWKASRQRPGCHGMSRGTLRIQLVVSQISRALITQYFNGNDLILRISFKLQLVSTEILQ